MTRLTHITGLLTLFGGFFTIALPSQVQAAATNNFAQQEKPCTGTVPVSSTIAAAVTGKAAVGLPVAVLLLTAAIVHEVSTTQCVSTECPRIIGLFHASRDLFNQWFTASLNTASSIWHSIDDLVHRWLETQSP